jgi:DNA-directed RNA polymerase specialized sigma24 family protein
MGEELFYDAAVLRVTRAILRSKGIRDPHDVEDGMHDVVEECIQHVRGTGRPPENVKQAIALARPIATHSGIEKLRKRTRRGKSNMGPTGDADAHAHEQGSALDVVDRKRMIAGLRQQLTDEQTELLADLAAGVTYEELAAEGNKSPAAMRKSAQRSREKGLGVLGAGGYVVAGGFGALLSAVTAVAIYLLVGRDEPHIVAQGNPYPELAAKHRRAGADACNAQRWDQCENDLNEAARFDPGSDRRIEVKALRAAIAEVRGATQRVDAGAAGSGAPTDGR